MEGVSGRTVIETEPLVSQSAVGSLGGGRDKCAHRKSREKCCASRKSVSLTVSLGESRSRMSQVLKGDDAGII